MAEKIDPRWARYGAELRQRRQTAGKTQADLGRNVLLSKAMISGIERGTRAPRLDNSEAFDTALSTGGVFTRMWNELIKHRYIPDWFQNALLLEREAHEIREYEPLVVPGLLQTSDYARALIAERRITASVEEVEKVVKTRTDRISAILKEGRPLMWFVIKESVFLDAVDDETIMRDELRHIVQLVEDGIVRIQVLPASTRASIAMSLPFRVFSLRESKQTVAYAEHAKGGTVIDAPDTVEELRSLFGCLQAEALAPSESTKLISKIMENRYGDLEEE